MPTFCHFSMRQTEFEPEIPLFTPATNIVSALGTQNFMMVAFKDIFLNSVS